jgi:hypothetical protein
MATRSMVTNSVATDNMATKERWIPTKPGLYKAKYHGEKPKDFNVVLKSNGLFVDWPAAADLNPEYDGFEWIKPEMPQSEALLIESLLIFEALIISGTIKDLSELVQENIISVVTKGRELVKVLADNKNKESDIK